MGVARLLARRARAQPGTLLTLLVLTATVAAILAGTVGYTRAAGVATVRSTLTEAAPRDAGIQVQTRLAADPATQDAAVRRTLSRLLPADGLAVSRQLWTEPVAASVGEKRVRVLLAEVPAGAEPDAGPLATGEVLVPEQTAADAGLTPGKRLDVAGTSLTVAGTWRAADERTWFADPVVAAGTDGSALGPLLASAETVGAAVDVPFVRWTVYPDPAALTVADLPRLAEGLSGLDFALRDDDAVAVRGLTLTGDLAGTVADLEEATGTAAAVGLVPVALLGVISLVALVQVVRLLGQTRARETEILVARGSSARQITAWSAAELGVVCVLGAGAGTTLAALVVGRLDGGEAQRPVILTVGAAVAVVALLAGTVVAGLQARAAARRTATDRSGRLRGAAAAGTLVLTGAGAALSTWQLLRHGTPLLDDGGADVLAVLSLGALLAALAVSALALLGPLARVVAGLLARRRGLVGVFAARQVSRRVRAYAVPLVLVVLTVGATTVSASFAGATAVQREHVAALATGADVRVELPAGTTSRLARPQSVSAVPYRELPGVSAAGVVLREAGRFGEVPVALTALPAGRLDDLTRLPDGLGLTGATAGLATAAPGVALPDGARALDVTVRASLAAAEGAQDVLEAEAASLLDRLVTLDGLSPEEAAAVVADELARLREGDFSLAAALWLADADGALSMLDVGELPADPDGQDALVGPEPAEHRLRVALPPGGPYRVVALDLAVSGPRYGSVFTYDVASLAADGADLPLGTWAPSDALGPAVDVEPPLGLRGALPAGTDTAEARLVPADVPAAVPAVVTAHLAATADLAVGDALPLALAGTSADLTVTAVADALPGGLEEDAVLVDLATLGQHVLARQPGPVLPRQVWLAVAADTDAADVGSAARELAGREAQVEVAGTGRTDSAASVRQAFWIAAGGSALLALTGVAAVVLALARERRSEVMVLRALGLPPAAQARSRAAELLGVGALGAVLGVVAGWLASAVLVPTLARASATDVSPLPLGGRLDVLPALGVLAVLAGGLLVVGAALAARVRAQALDAEYREEVR
ncbi:ABC transporter permease [Georgenia wutianyii]